MRVTYMRQCRRREAGSVRKMKAIKRKCRRVSTGGLLHKRARAGAGAGARAGGRAGGRAGSRAGAEAGAGARARARARARGP